MMSALITLMLCLLPAAWASATKPNIVLIVADDLGWNDVEFQNSDIKTPHLKALRSEGVLLENYFVQPICSPSRSQLLSGRYQVPGAYTMTMTMKMIY